MRQCSRRLFYGSCFYSILGLSPGCYLLSPGSRRYWKGLAASDAKHKSPQEWLHQVHVRVMETLNQTPNEMSVTCNLSLVLESRSWIGWSLASCAFRSKNSRIKFLLSDPKICHMRGPEWPAWRRHFKCNQFQLLGLAVTTCRSWHEKAELPRKKFLRLVFFASIKAHLILG